MSKILLYGATGYTGRLVAALLSKRREPFIVAGRRREEIESLALDLGAEPRVFGLDEAGDHLDGVSAILNCAGPFERTSGPLVEAALSRRAHYLDLAGEVGEHEPIRLRGPSAEERGVMLMPGVGFGIVPTDCAAALVARRLPSATKLIIAYETAGGASRGTLETVLRGLHKDGVVRKGGALLPSSPASAALDLDLGGGAARVVTNPWRADLVGAFFSTGIPDIETYATFPAPVRFLMRSPRLMGSAPMQSLLAFAIARAPLGPSPEARRAGRTRVLAVAEDGAGHRAEVRVLGPEAYDFTALTAAAIAARISEAKPGYQTPSRVFGPELLQTLEGVEVLS